jgi:hypothetical protein
MKDNEYISCYCCGHLLRNNAKENIHYGESPYPDDEGFGLCVECGGDKNTSDIHKRLGWAGRTFYDARIEVLSNNLSPENKAKFEALSYERKLYIIARLIELGKMI